MDLGNEYGSPVTKDYPKSGAKFNGEVNWVQIDVDKDAEDADHFITAEERLRVAMGIQ
jgi:arylsulfatase